MAKDRIYPTMKYFHYLCFDVGFVEAVEEFCDEKNNTLIDMKNEINALLKKNDDDLTMILRTEIGVHFRRREMREKLGIMYKAIDDELERRKAEKRKFYEDKELLQNNLYISTCLSRFLLR